MGGRQRVPLPQGWQDPSRLWAALAQAFAPTAHQSPGSGDPNEGLMLC